jgi:hypothetical protein
MHYINWVILPSMCSLWCTPQVSLVYSWKQRPSAYFVSSVTLNPALWSSGYWVAAPCWSQRIEQTHQQRDQSCISSKTRSSLGYRPALGLHGPYSCPRNISDSCWLGCGAGHSQGHWALCLFYRQPQRTGPFPCGWSLNLALKKLTSHYAGEKLFSLEWAPALIKWEDPHLGIHKLYCPWMTTWFPCLLVFRLLAWGVIFWAYDCVGQNKSFCCGWGSEGCA